MDFFLDVVKFSILDLICVCLHCLEHKRNAILYRITFSKHIRYRKLNSPVHPETELTFVDNASYVC